MTLQPSFQSNSQPSPATMTAKKAMLITPLLCLRCECETGDHHPIVPTRRSMSPGVLASTTMGVFMGTEQLDWG
jgi:hypothetical protein